MSHVTLLSITPNAEELIELAGRTCYQSEVAKDSAGPFIRRLIKNNHLSILEHATASFRLTNISRALTHQLVRHRLCSFAQQSQRFVSMNEPSFVEPESCRNNPQAHQAFIEAMKESWASYQTLRLLGVPKEDARFVLPNACCSEIVITTNFREWRTIFSLRCDKAAQWEIRQVCLAMLRILKEHCANVFHDLTF